MQRILKYKVLWMSPMEMLMMLLEDYWVIFLSFTLHKKQVPVMKCIPRNQVNSGEGGWDDVPVGNV